MPACQNQRPQRRSFRLSAKAQTINPTVASPKSKNTPKKMQVAKCVAVRPSLRPGYVRRKNETDPEKRKAEIERDPWTRDVMPNSVFCLGCQRPFVLDLRYTYGIGFWKKHKGLCKGIKQFYAQQQSQGQAVQVRSLTFECYHSMH